MTIKFSSSAANQYLSMADSAGLTYPAGDFCLSWLVAIDAVSGSNPEYLISNGTFQSTGSINVVYGAVSNGSDMEVLTASQANTDIVTTKKFTSGVWVFVLQRSGTTATIRSVPILQTLPTDGSSVVTDTKANYPTTAFDGAAGIFIGARSDLTATRFANQSIGRVFRFDGTLTDLEVAKLGYGMEITDLGHTPAWYIRMDTATDITDRGSQQNTVTPHGTLVTGTAPAFGYTGAPVAPAITSPPAIVGGANVGSASSVSPGATTGNPTPTNTYQWSINGAAVSGATGTTYTPVSSDAGKTLTVTQTASNGVGTSATSTSPGVVVATASSTIDVNQVTAERIYQRAAGVASIALSGTYTNTAPTSIEYQMYAADGSTVLVPWTAISGAVISGGSWSGTPAVTQGGMYRLCVRSKNGSTVLATSNIKANLFGVGDIFAWIGSSSAHGQFTDFSGSGYTPGANTRLHAGGTWSLFGNVGCAITAAIDLAARLGVPIGMMDYGVGGVTLVDWLDQNNAIWTNFVAAIANVGGKIAGLYNSVGSNDADRGLVPSRAVHLARLRQLFSNVRTLTGQPSLKMLHSGFNRRPATPDVQANYVRMAENDFGDDANVYHVQTLDFPLRDDDLIHMSAPGFIACSARTQAVFGQVLTGGSYIRGPKITSLVWSGNTVTFTLQHRNGTDFIPTSAINGFTVTDSDSSGVAPTVTSVARTSSTTGVITFNRTLVNPVAKYLSGSAPVSQSAAAPTNEVFDNGSPSLPMTVEIDMATTPSGTSSVTGVTLSPSSSTVSGGSTRQFTATVQGNSPSQAVTWTKTSGVGSISSSGLYTSPASTSSAQSAVIRATSVQDGTYVAEASVTVPAVVPGSTVTGVTVTPSSVTVAGGGTVDFDWVIAGTNNPSQAATVSTTLGQIDASGILTAPFSTTVTQIGTVTVTSSQDTSQKGYATFTVAAVVVPLPTPSPSPVIPLYSPMFVPKNTAAPSVTPYWPVAKSQVSLPPGIANVGEYGFALSAGVGYNLTANVSLGIKITRPDGTIVMRATPLVTIGSTPLVTDFGTFAANEYAVYLVQDGDFTVPGLYVARLIYTDANKRLVSEPAGFVVNA